MDTPSSPVAIPLHHHPRKRLFAEAHSSSVSELLEDVFSEQEICEEEDYFSSTASSPPVDNGADLSAGHTVTSPTSPSSHDYYPFSPPRINLSRSSSTISSLSSPSTLSKLARAISPPRILVQDDPLSTCEEEESDSTVEENVIKEAKLVLATSKRRPKRRQSTFQSSLTASLSALKTKLPTSPTIYTPPLLPLSPSTYPREAISPTSPPSPSSSSLPTFAYSDIPTSSTVQLQTYSVSLGPPRKPREARINSDFLRLLALEMEMRRSGKLVLPPEVTERVQGEGIIVSGKVRMVLPRREREREDVNISMFNRSRLKW